MLQSPALELKAKTQLTTAPRTTKHAPMGSLPCKQYQELRWTIFTHSKCEVQELNGKTRKFFPPCQQFKKSENVPRNDLDRHLSNHYFSSDCKNDLLNHPRYDHMCSRISNLERACFMEFALNESWYKNRMLLGKEEILGQIHDLQSASDGRSHVSIIEMISKLS